MVQTAELLQRDVVQRGGVTTGIRSKETLQKKKKCPMSFGLVSLVQNGTKLRRLKDIKFFELSVV